MRLSALSLLLHISAAGIAEIRIALKLRAAIGTQGVLSVRSQLSAAQAAEPCFLRELTSAYRAARTLHDTVYPQPCRSDPFLYAVNGKRGKRACTFGHGKAPAQHKHRACRRQQYAGDKQREAGVY